MIPKVIHYCWFGRKEKPELVKKCMKSWHLFCPEFKIIEWNEENFDINQHPYLRWCYQNEKWAFLSDFARLLILKEHGGIYLDTDVEIIRPIDDLLQYEAFYGFETDQAIATGLGFGCIANHPTVTAMIESYQVLTPKENGEYIVNACPFYNTEALAVHGLVKDGKHQTVLGAEIFPADYFNPYDDPTGKLQKTKNTYSIHWYGKSWMNRKTILRSKLMKPLHRVFGTDFIMFKIMRRK